MDDQSGQFEELHEEASSSFDWRRYYFAILDRWWIVGLAILLGILAALFHLRGQETVFRARAVLVFDPDSNRVLQGVQSVRELQIRSVDMLNTLMEGLRGYPFALRVAERMDLANDENFREAVGAGDNLTAGQAAGYLRSMVEVGHRRNTRLVDLLVTSRSGAVATAIANGYADEYIRLLIEQNTEAAVSAGKFLVEEGARLGEKLRVSEEAVQSFRERERAASFETMLTEAQGRVASVSDALAQARSALAQIDADLDLAASLEEEEALLELPSIAADPRLREIKEILALQEAEIDLLGQRYLAGHPVFATAMRRVERTRTDRSEALQSVIAGLAARRDTIAVRAAQMEEELTTAQNRLLEVTGKSIEYNSLMRELETDRAIHAAVLERLKEVDLTKGLTDESIRIQEPALGAGPVPIPVARVLAMGIVGGLMAGIALVLLLDALDASIRTVEHAERETGYKVITAFPDIKMATPDILAAKERHGLVAEGFRTLRTALALLGGRDSRHIFLVTSALPNEGKTFTSSNFAATLAQQGFRTLLVDADLRKPTVSKIFFGEHRKPGLTEILLGSAGFSEAVRPCEFENLSVITAGGRPENPSELLSGARIESFFAEAREKFDRIVIDSAPVVAVSDALLLTKFADANCLVICANSTPLKSVQHAIRLLEESGAPPAGLVVNRLKAGRLGARYSYSYSGRTYGHYGSKGVYGQRV